LNFEVFIKLFFAGSKCKFSAEFRDFIVILGHAAAQKQAIFFLSILRK
jgi:hypothetical protein